MVKNRTTLNNLSKTYDYLTVLDKLSLDIKKNEFLSLLGSSGCGKTTILKIISGFEYVDEEKALFDKEMNNIPPYQRTVNTVFQKCALFTHMNVYENKSFILKIKKLSKDEIDKKVNENYRKWIFHNTKTAENESELGMDISRRYPYNVLIC